MEKQVQGTIRINATPEQVWDALTNNHKIAQYMYGARAMTDWVAGSPIDYYVDKAGQDVGVVKGTLTKVEPPFYLEYTMFPVGWEELNDATKNYLNSSYRIVPVGNECKLTITVWDFTVVAMGKQRYEHTIKGFEEWMEKIKEVAEG